MQTDADNALAEAKQHILEARDKLREATHPSTMGSDEYKQEVSRGIIQLEQYLTMALFRFLNGVA